MSKSSIKQTLLPFVPHPWNAIPEDARQRKTHECAYAVVRQVAHSLGVDESGWQAVCAALRKEHGTGNSLSGIALDEEKVLFLLQKMRIAHELLPRSLEALNARIDAGEACVLLFEQYSCGYGTKFIQKARMALGIRAEHTVLVVGRHPSGHVVFDPGWAKGGWQILTHDVLQKALANERTTLIAVSAERLSVVPSEIEGKRLFVNGKNGHWCLSDGNGLSEELEDYLYAHDELIAPFSSTSEFKPHEFIINVTDRCNCGCRYCYAAAKASGADMTPECFLRVAREACRLAGDQQVNLVLHGGEPLLVLESLGSALETVSRELSQVRLSMQTSGDTLDQAKLDLISRNRIQVGLSIDGPEDIHNGQRGKFAESMKAFALLQDKPFFSGTITTLTKDSCARIAEIIGFFAANGILRLAFSPVVPTGRALRFPGLVPSAEDLATAYLTAWREMLRYRNDGVPLEIREFNHLIMHLLSNLRPMVCGMTPCAACKSILGVDSKGEAYVCDMLIGRKEFSLGNIWDLTADKVKALWPTGLIADDAPDYVPGCRDCRWRKHCMRGCPANNLFWNTVGRRSGVCAAHTRLLERIAVDVSTNDVAADYAENVVMSKLTAENVLRKETIA